MSKRADQWTALELAELFEEPRLGLVREALDLAKRLDWPIESTAPEALPDEPSLEVSCALAMMQYLAEKGLLVESVTKGGAE